MSTQNENMKHYTNKAFIKGIKGNLGSELKASETANGDCYATTSLFQNVKTSANGEKTQAICYRLNFFGKDAKQALRDSGLQKGAFIHILDAEWCPTIVKANDSDQLITLLSLTVHDYDLLSAAKEKNTDAVADKHLNECREAIEQHQ